MKQVDCVIEARWVIPVEPNGVLEQHAVVVDGGRIESVLPAETARQRYLARQRVELAQHAVIPGLVNLHTHAAMTLMRGLADDIALMTWLKEHIWPVEMREASPGFVYDGTLLACAEMLRGGITLFNDMYFFPEAAARAAIDAGMRAALGMIVVDFPSPYASDPLDYLTKGLAVRDELRAEPLLSFCFAPHAPYSVSDKALVQVATYANELDVPVHIHLHETRDEVTQGEAHDGRRPLGRLQELGLVGPNLLAVHAVHLTDPEIAVLAQHGCHVAHCASSNLKLASGMAPVAKMVAAGINVGLGTDGAASNNRLDMFAEMRQAALLAKAVAGDPTALPAPEVLRMATLGGAKALALDACIGSLTPGKMADMVAVDFGRPELSPCYDPLSHLIYVAGRQDVSHVWVAGELLVEEGVLTRPVLRTAAARAGHWQQRIAPAAGPGARC
ncbi:MAG: TRZ/ATZ family hydrolase [Betaproteobacteria bacterium]|nr:MAG: TRZ/ATZ family hydrolase [Betaproteobacteria bacterium]